MLGRWMLVALAGLLGLGAPALAQEAFRSDRITVTVEGSGPDVILIPGMTSSPSAWRGTAAALPGYSYHFVQLKGFAGTPAEGNEEGPVSAPVAAEIARYIDAQNLDRPAVVGHSMGGTMALMIAARHPRAVSRVMVVDQLPFMGVVFGPPGTTAESVRPTAEAMRAEMLNASAEAHNQRLEAMSGAMVRDEAQRALVIADAKASDRETVANAFRELIMTDLRPELAAIRVPVSVLYVTPAGAPATDAQVDALYRASYAPIADLRLVRIPDSAHFIMSDNPARFQAELRALLSR